MRRVDNARQLLHKNSTHMEQIFLFPKNPTGALILFNILEILFYLV